MNKNKRKILNPKYRFSKFNNKWEYCELGSIANKVTKKNTLGKITRVLTNSASEGIVDQGDYFERTIVNQNNIKNYFIIKQGDFVYNPRISSIAPVGPISRNNIGDGIISPLYTVFRFNNKNNDFYEQYYKTSLWHKYLKEISNQGARFDRMSILDEDFFNMPIPYNKDSEELQEIANSIISIDNLILLEEEKLEKLKFHKNGLLQKLFPKRNSQAPEWRFKEFNNCEKWDIIPLRKLALYRRGSFPQPYGLPEWYDNVEGMPFIQVFDVDENLKLKVETKNKISKIAQQQSVYIPKGTIVVTIQGSIGRVAITDYDAYIDRTLLLFEKFYKKVDKKFIAYSLQLLFDIEKQKAPGGIIKTITKEVLSSFNISLPKYKEQQKIADCISSIDDLISAQTEKIEVLKQHKKGLLQGVFPSIEEVENE